MLDGHTHYTPAGGLLDLRGSVAKRYREMYGLEATAENVIICNGAKHVIHNALTAVCGPGDNAEPSITIMFPDQD